MSTLDQGEDQQQKQPKQELQQLPSNIPSLNDVGNQLQKDMRSSSSCGSQACCTRRWSNGKLSKLSTETIQRAGYSWCRVLTHRNSWATSYSVDCRRWWQWAANTTVNTAYRERQQRDFMSADDSKQWIHNLVSLEFLSWVIFIQKNNLFYSTVFKGDMGSGGWDWVIQKCPHPRPNVTLMTILLIFSAT